MINEDKVGTSEYNEKYDYAIKELLDDAFPKNQGTFIENSKRQKKARRKQS